MYLVTQVFAPKLDPNTHYLGLLLVMYTTQYSILNTNYSIVILLVFIMIYPELEIVYHLPPDWTAVP